MGVRLRKFYFFLFWLSITLAIALLAGNAPMTFVVLNPTANKPGQLPEGWQLKVNRGDPDVTAVEEGAGHVLRLKSRKSSFGIEKGVDVDPSQLPYLSWNWKVSELPRGGDFRRTVTDDQAAQVLVAFADRRILTYIWDSSAPKGVMQSSSAIPLVHIWAFVCRSGGAEINQWVSETRNISEDYQKAYKHPPSRIRGIRLQINTQHTGSSAESYFGEISFRNAPQ